MIRSYRTTTQLVDRVRLLGGHGVALTGHHEILLPLLAGLVLDALGEPPAPCDSGSKLVARGELAALGAALRARGKRVVFTNGCFDLLHVGHTRYLRQARDLGDALVVGLNTDAGVRRLKGETRPLVCEAERAEVLASLACVDYVTLFDEALPSETIAALRPDLHVKGGDYTTEQLPEAPLVLAYGGEVRILPLAPGRSTTALAGRLAE
ncbi:MAG: D-glycero-beta-D-manno-heptose 1-phosphate adenylyltransferase [Armatimonadetes bacterium]|nr:D-glycero-beta-D-manno-heptose 1-phosphate adenylyltransferase [Armatimonadota bacterium]